MFSRKATSIQSLAAAQRTELHQAFGQAIGLSPEQQSHLNTLCNPEAKQDDGICSEVIGRYDKRDPESYTSAMTTALSKHNLELKAWDMYMKPLEQTWRARSRVYQEEINCELSLAPDWYNDAAEKLGLRSEQLVSFKRLMILNESAERIPNACELYESCKTLGLYSNDEETISNAVGTLKTEHERQDASKAFQIASKELEIRAKRAMQLNASEGEDGKRAQPTQAGGSSVATIMASETPSKRSLLFAKLAKEL